MRFELSEDQTLLKDATTSFFASESPIETSREVSEADGEGFSRGQWKKLAELGYLGLIAAESAGGAGLGAIELSVVLQQAGRVCFPGPLLDVVLATRALTAAGGQDETITQIAAGEKIVVLAQSDRVWPDDIGGATFADGHVKGSKVFVPFAASADALLVTTDAGLVLAEGPFACEPMPTVDEAQRFARVEFDNAATLIGDNTLVEGVWELAHVGAAALALGVCEAAGEATIRYSTERETFGKPIGVYQVLQHRMADMVLRTESSRAIVFRAAWSLDNGAADRGLVAVSAKQYAVESANEITLASVQIHGGNGFTWEYNVHRWLKLAMTLDHHYGARNDLLERALEQVEAQ